MLEICTTIDFFKLIAKNKFVLVDLYTTWCGPCKIMKPLIESIESNYESIIFAKVDVDKLPELSQTYNIRSIPLLILFRDGQEIARQVGAVPKTQLEEFINKHLLEQDYEKEEIEKEVTA